MFELLQGNAPGQWVWAWTLQGAELKLSAQLKAFTGKPRLRVKGNEMEEMKRLDYSNVLPTDPQLWKNALCIPGKWIRLTDSRCSEG